MTVDTYLPLSLRGAASLLTAWTDGEKGYLVVAVVGNRGCGCDSDNEHDP